MLLYTELNKLQDLTLFTDVTTQSMTSPFTGRMTMHRYLTLKVAKPVPSLMTPLP